MSKVKGEKKRGLSCGAKVKQYSSEFKVTVAMEMLAGNSSKHAIAHKYGVSESSVRNWAQKLKTLQPHVFELSSADRSLGEDESTREYQVEIGIERKLDKIISLLKTRLQS